jgi:hypothetical protein
VIPITVFITILTRLIQSFVKLNNIEYAVQQLDVLEKTMNVDACAEVLNKIKPPKEKQRRPSKYVKDKGSDEKSQPTLG